MYIVIFHYDIPPLSYWLQLTDRNFILQGRFIKSFKDSSLKLYRTPGLTRGFLYTKKISRLMTGNQAYQPLSIEWMMMSVRIFVQSMRPISFVTFSA